MPTSDHKKPPCISLIPNIKPIQIREIIIIQLVNRRQPNLHTSHTQKDQRLSGRTERADSGGPGHGGYIKSEIDQDSKIIF